MKQKTLSELIHPNEVELVYRGNGLDLLDISEEEKKAFLDIFGEIEELLADYKYGKENEENRRIS